MGGFFGMIFILILGVLSISIKNYKLTLDSSIEE
jgi:hypothetical protein